MNYRSSTYPGAGSSSTNVFQDPQRWFPPVFYENQHSNAGGPYYYYNDVQSSNMPNAGY